MLLLATGVLLVMASFAASQVLFSHRRLTTWLATTVVVLELHWLLLTAVASVWPARNPSFAYVLAAGVLLLCWATLFWYRRQPLRLAGFGIRDFWVLVTCVTVIGGAFIVTQFNGLQGTDFVLHGFYNGDVVTFASLIQRAVIGETGNPFAAGGSLEYPTLLHQSLGQLIRELGLSLDWIYFWPLLTLAQIAVTIPLFFLLWDILLPEPQAGELWLGIRRRSVVYMLQAAVTAGIITLSWDNYTYPQSHFFLTASFLLLGALLFRSPGALSLLTSGIVAGLLLQSNAVTGTAALVCFVVAALVVVSGRQRPLYARLVGVGMALLLACLFFVATPGEASWGQPHFSYTGALELGRLTPWLVVLLAGLALQYLRHPIPTTVTTGLLAATVVVFLFSTRDLIVANAGRFIYHALLVSTPLLIRPLVRLCFYYRREFLLSTRSWLERLSAATLLLTTVFFLLLPNAASVASAYDNLLFKDERRISFLRREVLWWIADNSQPDSIIIASPYAPWDIPLFTGRALLRAAHSENAFWLSPDDGTLMQLVAAFAGDQAAQRQVIELGDYLVLSAEEQTRWPTNGLKEVFATKQYRIYQTR